MLEQSYQIPGPFVALQGMSGDGIVNTVATTPKFAAPTAHQKQQIQDTPTSSLTLDRAAQEAAETWKEECCTNATFEATEWLQMAKQYGNVSSKEHSAAQLLPTLHGLSSGDRWWLWKGQLRVFDGLPDPSSRTTASQGDVIPPGSKLQAVCLHTWEKTMSNSGGPGTSGSWLYKGACTSTSGSQLPAGHEPQAGRLQFLQVEVETNPFLNFFGNAGPRFVAYSVDGYSFLVPGAPTSALFTGKSPADFSDNTTAAGWYWKVTCAAGAVVRQGLDLQSTSLATLPYGTHVQVTQKVVNPQGLSRLNIKAILKGRPIAGWCSEFLNPRSGQRGPVVQPIPPAVPVLWRVVLRDGATVRSQVELASPVVETLRREERVPVLSRTFSEFPASHCVPRLQLAKRAFASLYLANGTKSPILQPTQTVDPAFEAGKPEVFHYRLHVKWTDAVSSSLDEDDGGDAAMLSHPDSVAVTGRSQSTNHPVVTCVVCLEAEADATLVHGETGHICCCLECARLCKAQGSGCPLCRKPIDRVILHFYS